MFVLLTLGYRIRYAREKIGLKPQELALRINISQPYMSQIENDSRKPGRETLIKIAKVLNEPIDFFTGSDLELYPKDGGVTSMEYHLPGGKSIVIHPQKYIKHFAALDEAKEAGLSEKQINEAIQFAIKMKTQA